MLDIVFISSKYDRHHSLKEKEIQKGKEKIKGKEKKKIKMKNRKIINKYQINEEKERQRLRSANLR